MTAIKSTLPWPYDWQGVESRLDPASIEAQGRFFLNRAFNIERTIAFVGVGTSMAYGRVSWGELGLTQVSGIVRSLSGIDKNKEPAVAQLVNQLSSLEKKVKEEKGDSVILAMQIAEQIWTLASETALESLLVEFGLDLEIAKTKTRKDIFRYLIKSQTYDETAHICRILENPFNSFRSHESAPLFENLLRETLSRRKMSRFHSSRTAWDTEAVFSRGLSKLVNDSLNSTPADQIADEARDLGVRLGRLLDKAFETQADHEFVPPYRYYAFGTQLDLLRFASGRTRNANAVPPAEKFILEIAEKKNKRAEPEPAQDRQRSRVIRRDHDPLWLLVEKLEITRFATTNYDLEIERLLGEIGFRKTDYDAQAELADEDIERVGPMGGRVREIVLNEHSAVDLIDFATTHTAYSVQVVHLHGRATEDTTQLERDDLVVTERDYQAKYLGDSPYQVSSREGFQIMFGGNPVLFIGLGLAEGDVMRPLREFAGNQKGRNNSIFALRHASDSQLERDVFAIEQYIRYGVYIIYYGFIDSFKEDGDTDHKYPWIEKFYDYVKSITDTIDNVVGAWSKEKDRKIVTDSFRSAANIISEKQEAFRKVFADAGEKLEGFQSDGGDCDISFECRFIDEIGDFLCRQATAERLDAWLAESESVPLFSSVLRKAVTRTQNAVLVKALSACLSGLERRWRAWPSSWLKAPRSRTSNLRYSTSDPGPDPLVGQVPSLQSTRWFRHFIVDPMIDLDDNPVPFGAFMQALLPLGHSDHHRRRIFLVAGPRGAGKGSWFSQFAKTGDFILDPNAFQRDRPDPRKRYAGQFFANFSFSSEVASVWDALTAFLVNPQLDVSVTEMGSEWDPSAGRLERLRTALGLLTDRASRTAAALQGDLEVPDIEVVPRYLVVLQAFDLLFEDDGYPKNAEIREICNLLFGKPSSVSPLDIVLIFNDANTPLYFRSETVTPDATVAQSVTICDRRKKCRGQSLQLIADERVLVRGIERSHIKAIVKSAGIELVGAAYASNVLLHDLLPPAQQNTGDSQPYLFVIPRTNPDDKFPGENTQFRFSRYHNLLEMIVRRDRKERSVPGYFVFEANGYDSSDDFLSRVMEYWYTCEFVSAIDESAVTSIFNKAKIDEQFDPPLARQAGDAQLHELLIRHLAVISVPVEPDVLAVCPRIAGRLQEIVGSSTDKLPFAQAIAMIRHALALLTARGLVFIFNKGVATGTEKSATERYQVHRSIQLHVYRKLGSQNIEPARSYFFSISLYASQTKELPSLTANAYAFLHDLVDGLIAYPSSRHAAGERGPELTARCLRAALGISRTLFSIGVVARFADYGRVAIPLPPRSGYFEHHRLALGWMLRKAADIKEEAPVAASTSGGPVASAPPLHPFYPDEVAWLLNEVGVFSLAQGQCYDAVALLEKAKLYASSIEGEDGGSMTRRILVNLGACAINRGRPNEARQLLQKVCRETEEDETVRMIAHGYLGVLDHLAGATDLAFRRYGEAISRLSDLGRNRPVSLFRRYRGELHRHMRDFKAAESDFVAAIDRAREARYEDMANFAIVSRARMMVARGRASDFKEVAKTLETAERYAESMELPMLKSEVSFVHAKLLLKQGETAIAGEKATRALRIATLNGLILRTVAYRELLVEIYLERGWLEQAKRMKLQVLQAAKDTGYMLITQGTFDRK